MIVLSNESGDCYQTSNFHSGLMSYDPQCSLKLLPWFNRASHLAPLKYSQYHYQVYQICIYQRLIYILRLSLKGKGNIFIIDKPQAK